MSAQVRRFAELLGQYTSVPIILCDERLTSAMGERMLKEAELNHKQRKKVIDGISAAILLQNYLERRQTTRIDPVCHPDWLSSKNASRIFHPDWLSS